MANFNEKINSHKEFFLSADGCDYFMTMYEHLKSDNMLVTQGGPIKEISFAGLPDTCELIAGKTEGKILVFPGDETPIESLRMYHVPE